MSIRLPYWKNPESEVVQAVGSITDMPGCPAVAIFHNAFVFPEHRAKKVGQQAHQDRLNCANGMGYDYTLCTVRADNLAQRRILEKMQWTKLDQFRSRNSGHLVELWGRRMSDVL